MKKPELNCEFGKYCFNSAVSNILGVAGAIGSALNGPLAI